jgi:hypothetical protein
MSDVIHGPFVNIIFPLNGQTSTYTRFGYHRVFCLDEVDTEMNLSTMPMTGNRQFRVEGEKLP